MSHCFERRFGKEIEDLSKENKIHVSYHITEEEKKLYHDYENIIAKITICMNDYDIILYMSEYYPFKAPQIIIRREKNSKDIMNEWNQNMTQSVLEYIGDDDYDYYTIQSFTFNQMNFYCTNQEEKEIFLKWKYEFDNIWFNRYKYSASLRLKEIIPDVIKLMNLIQIQKEKYSIPQI